MKSIRGLLFPQEKIFFELLERESKNALKAAVELHELTSNFKGKTEKYANVSARLRRCGELILNDTYNL